MKGKQEEESINYVSLAERKIPAIACEWKGQVFFASGIF